jgi:hypothetical protein
MACSLLHGNWNADSGSHRLLLLPTGLPFQKSSLDICTNSMEHDKICIYSNRFTFSLVLDTAHFFQEPVLIQACLINLASSACFSNFWVTLTFLLGGPPYFYSTFVIPSSQLRYRSKRIFRLVIGLFGLVGMFGVAMGPVIGRTIDKLVPWYASFAGILFNLVFQAVEVGGGGINIAAVILATFGMDVFRQTLQVSLSAKIFRLIYITSS